MYTKYAARTFTKQQLSCNPQFESIWYKTIQKNKTFNKGNNMLKLDLWWITYTRVTKNISSSPANPTSVKQEPKKFHYPSYHLPRPWLPNLHKKNNHVKKKMGSSGTLGIRKKWMYFIPHVDNCRLCGLGCLLEWQDHVSSHVIQTIK